RADGGCRLGLACAGLRGRDRADGKFGLAAACASLRDSGEAHRYRTRVAASAVCRSGAVSRAGAGVYSGGGEPGTVGARCPRAAAFVGKFARRSAAPGSGAGKSLDHGAARPVDSGDDLSRNAGLCADGGNRMMRTRVVAAVALLCAACGSGRKAGEVRNQLRISIAGDPKSFDPLQAIEDSSDTVRYLTSGVLLRVNRATDALEPELAESWKMSDDGRTISFHLRPGLKFSDNSPLDANDVARTLRRALDPKTASPFGDTFAGNPTITVSSPLDITIAYAGPKPGLDRLFDTLPIAPAKLATLPA